jgi:inorganic triphosphatase YgiF
MEWQFDAKELEPVENWLKDCSGGPDLVVSAGLTNNLVDTYYDTEDWQLYYTGYALRIRREGGVASETTMKSLVPAEGNLHRRREISEPLKSDKVEALLTASGPVGTFLKDLVDVRELRLIFEVHTRRQIFDLLYRQGVDLENTQTGGPVEVTRSGEVALDSSTIPLGVGKEPVRLARVEVEVGAYATTAISELERFVKALERDLKLWPATTSKYEVGLSATGQNPNGVTNSNKAANGSRVS